MCNLIVTNITDTSRIKNANKLGKLRGPDSENLVNINNITFLHNLLSITGNNVTQPYISSDQNLVIIFNGEIYNYDCLVENKNLTEIEVIVELYQSGIENIKKLDGEFAIVICDFTKKNLYLIHDIFAIKPLYLGFDNNDFCISSYPSVSQNLGITRIFKIPPNCCLQLNMQTLE